MRAFRSNKKRRHPAGDNSSPRIVGRVIGHPDGYGFVVPKDTSKDVFLSRKQMQKIFHGDEVQVRVTRTDRQGRLQGTVEEVASHNTRRIVGTAAKHGNGWTLIPEERRYGSSIPLLVSDPYRPDPGDVVVSTVILQPDQVGGPLVSVIEVLGSKYAPGVTYQIALERFEIPYLWPDSVTQAVANFPKQVRAVDRKGRIDFREIEFVTIDGEDAHDFDDAVYCEPTADGWRLLVAIADVSHYVNPDSPLDVVAAERGNSVYFPHRVVPMLPESLSNNLCSLVPNEDRLCLVCDMQVNLEGEIAKYCFHRVVIRSRARLTYTQVAEFLETASPQNLSAELQHCLARLADLYQALARARTNRGVIEFETPEPVIELDASGAVLGICPRPRNLAHRIIEECMISANLCAADLLTANGIPTLYRIHERPDEERISALRAFLFEFGLKLSGNDVPNASDFRKVLEAVVTLPHAQVIEMAVLRSLKRAVYSEQEQGHFGIAVSRYCHFTSPIRRYPDLVVHRGIIHLLGGHEPKSFGYKSAELAKLGQHCSMTERRADEATRDVYAWYKCLLLQQHVGEVFDGYITGVTAFGLFVTIEQFLADGLLHVSALPSDYYSFDAQRHRLGGSQKRHSYQLGDPVSVLVARVDPESRKVDFILPS